MSKIIQFSEHKPHFGGQAICTACEHEWIAVAPMTADKETLECPSCKRNLGVTKSPFVPEVYLECDCGSSLYYISPDARVCRNCGKEAEQ